MIVMGGAMIVAMSDPRFWKPPVETGGWNGTKSASADSTPPASPRDSARARRTGLAASEGRLRAVVAAASAARQPRGCRSIWLEVHPAGAPC
ncbi:MAG TPA: hypothetical protein VHG91_04980 [Longimicrobium sp.]|nr:hypothetical protein [Longimicrobium sp.]